MNGPVADTQAGTLVLTAADVTSTLDMDACIAAIERAFAAHGRGEAATPGILGIHAAAGGFHIKAGLLDTGERGFFVAKINSNFRQNPVQHGLPTIQGMVALYDATDGRLLALMDSIELTALRTAAATAVAARHLARADAGVVSIVGCGKQSRAQLRALARVRTLRAAFALDTNPAMAQAFARDMSGELRIPVTCIDDVTAAMEQSDMCVTCTPSRVPLLHRGQVRPGTFVAGVGADSEDKHELAPDLLAAATVVVDVLEQAATIGDLHHAIAAGVLTRESARAELGAVVAGRAPGRTSDHEITVFDSTGMALQDAAAAAVAYSRASRSGNGVRVRFGDPVRRAVQSD